MKILFIIPYSSEGPSNRYRVEQYLPYLRENNCEYRIRPFVSSDFYKIIYKKGHIFKKTYYFLESFFKRIFDVINAHKYDVIFIHREACPFGPPIFEWLLYKSKKSIIFDFDDAIFLKNFNPANSFYRFFKSPSKTRHIIGMSKAVIVANRFLKEYANKTNKNVYIIPTCVDTASFNVARKNNDRLVIGWIGSPTTAPYLKIVFHAMQRLSQKYDFVLKIVGAGEKIFIKDVNVENIAWQLDREIEDFQSIDIGIYPMPDTLWACGKASFKAIQYMAVGVPVVASSVGMVKEIIQDGVNGFLVDLENEWIDKISKLMENSELRRTMGLAGRKIVEERFSVAINAPRYFEIITQ